MNKLLTVLFTAFFLFSCGKNDLQNTDDQNESGMTANAGEENINPDEIIYKGTYKGRINGKDIELTIDDETFSISENGRHANGSWQIIDDGKTLGLEPKSGKVVVRFFGYSDGDTWIALTDSLTYFEPEQYLKRVK